MQRYRCIQLLTKDSKWLEETGYIPFQTIFREGSVKVKRTPLLSVGMCDKKDDWQQTTFFKVLSHLIFRESGQVHLQTKENMK